jgi:hypothetical protein
MHAQGTACFWRQGPRRPQFSFWRLPRRVLFTALLQAEVVRILRIAWSSRHPYRWPTTHANQQLAEPGHGAMLGQRVALGPASTSGRVCLRSAHAPRCARKVHSVVQAVASPARIDELVPPELGHDEEAAFCGSDGALSPPLLPSAAAERAPPPLPSTRRSAAQGTCCHGRRRRRARRSMGGTTTSTRLAAR